MSRFGGTGRLVAIGMGSPLLVLYGPPLVAGAAEQVPERADDVADAADVEMTPAIVVGVDPAAHDLVLEARTRHMLDGEGAMAARQRPQLAPVERLALAPVKEADRLCGRLQRAMDHRADRRDAGAVGDEDGLGVGRAIEDERAPWAGEADD